MKKQTPKQVRVRTYLILAVGILLAYGGGALGDKVGLLLAGKIVIFAALFHHITFYRCPHCDKFLDRSTGEYCPRCGKNVNEPEL